MKAAKNTDIPLAELPQRPRPLVPTKNDEAAVYRVPLHDWRGHWLSVSEFASVMNRHEQTVYKWLRMGTLAEFGIPVAQFRHGRLHSGRVFILNIY